MDHNDDSSVGRWQRASLDRRGLKALTAIQPERHSELMAKVHLQTDAMKRFGAKLQRGLGIQREGKVEFEYEPVTGSVFVKLFDAETGELQVKLTPEEVAKGLQGLEETEDSVMPLSSFFADLHV